MSTSRPDWNSLLSCALTVVVSSDQRIVSCLLCMGLALSASSSSLVNCRSAPLLIDQSGVAKDKVEATRVNRADCVADIPGGASLTARLLHTYVCCVIIACATLDWSVTNRDRQPGKAWAPLSRQLCRLLSCVIFLLS